LPTKREEFKRDTGGEDQESLDNQFQEIKAFCLEEAETNCFLLDKDTKGEEVALIHELVDLKLLHLVRSRVDGQWSAREHFRGNEEETRSEFLSLIRQRPNGV